MSKFPNIRIAILSVMAILRLSGLICAQQSGPVYEKIFSFTDAQIRIPADNSIKGGEPGAGLVQGVDGDFYGTTSIGGSSDCGTVFRLTPDGVLKTLVEFTGEKSGSKRGSHPNADLVLGNDGNFYGTTTAGGEYGMGTVFMMPPGGGEEIKTLVDFNNSDKGENRGGNPAAGLLLGLDGNFYGTTKSGGAGGTKGYGTVFMLPPGSGGKIKTLVDFNGGNGKNPTARLAADKAGHLYGTTSAGGSGFGTVFKIPLGHSYIDNLKPLAIFTGKTSTQGRGIKPIGNLVSGSGDDFYGTTSEGGTSGDGTIFRITSKGELSTLVDFNRNDVVNSGASPKSGLLQGVDGRSFYGTTVGGGKSGNGTIYKITQNQTGKWYLTTLVEFTYNGPGNKGAFADSALFRGSDGSLYGTTRHGGEFSSGTAFRMNEDGMLTTLVNFIGPAGGNIVFGGGPMAQLMLHSDKNYYGTTSKGGRSSCGTIFKMTTGGKLTTLVNFTGYKKNPQEGDNRGGSPSAVLVEGTDHNIYGTTASGGSYGKGTIFQLVRDKATGDWKLNTLVDFTGKKMAVVPGSTLLAPGSAPFAGIMSDHAGSFYGTTYSGGKYNKGTIFYLSRVNSKWRIETLADFSGNARVQADDKSIKGANPICDLVQDVNSLGKLANIYGCTYAGGIHSCGTVFKLTYNNSHKKWESNTMFDFTGDESDGSKGGAAPKAGLIRRKDDGNFYGTTSAGGAGGNGTVFTMTPGGNPQTLIDFTDNDIENKGKTPTGRLEVDGMGNIYGTTSAGGGTGDGTVFKMILGNNKKWILKTLADLSRDDNTNRLSNPSAGLVFDNNENLYGTTLFGGDSGHGAIFKMTTKGETTKMVDFGGDGTVNNGKQPVGRLVGDIEGRAYYGTTNLGGVYDKGTVFKITPGGTLTTLVSFVGSDPESANRGAFPQGDLLRGRDGSFYGVTSHGGRYGFGTVFVMDPAGNLSTLADFKGILADPSDPARGMTPKGGLVQDVDGNIYGATRYGGVKSAGTLFKMRLSGTPFLESRDFSGTNGIDRGGSFPDGDIVVDVNNKCFYGTTSGNGLEKVDSTVFKFDSDLDIKTICKFSTPAETGNDPSGILVHNGKIYGTNRNGGANGSGTVFSLHFNKLKNFWQCEHVMAFGPVNDNNCNIIGKRPLAGLVIGRDGNFYGTNSSGGAFGFGTVFRMHVIDSSHWKLDTLIDFSAAEDGSPSGRLAADFNGNLYGTTMGPAGSVYRMAFPGATILVDPSATPSGSYGAIVEVKVNPCGSATDVFLEYGTNGDDFKDSSVSGNMVTRVAVASNLSGYQTKLVGCTIGSLLPNTIYYYRFRTGNGEASSHVASFTTSSDGGGIADLDRKPPGGRLAATGTVKVMLSVDASTASGISDDWRFGWRFVGEGDRSWRKSGDAVGNLEPGTRTIEFRPAPGYSTPPPVTVQVVNDQIAANPVDSGTYHSDNTQEAGTLKVVLNVPNDFVAQWRFVGETVWHDNMVTTDPLVYGEYFVEFKWAKDLVTPEDCSVLINSSETILKKEYKAAKSGESVSPTPYNVDGVYPYVGQIRSDAGSGSGFVVKPHVVATAAHVVFDDNTLSAATGVQWLFQRDNVSYVPRPQVPSGFYYFDDYASLRKSENHPGTSSAYSFNRDVAALYFINEEIGRGGYGGFIASDRPDANEFLVDPPDDPLSASQRVLLGYPVEGIDPIYQDSLHQWPLDSDISTPPGKNINFLHYYQFLYTTSDVHGSGGLSGGPVCVKHMDQEKGEVYYPAAIYLGDLDSENGKTTVVRSINSEVVDLFTRAEITSVTGDNENSVGHGDTETPRTGNDATDGSLVVHVEPAGAADSATWAMDQPEPYASDLRHSDYKEDAVTPGIHRVYFQPVAGYKTPPNADIDVKAGDPPTPCNGIYVPIPVIQVKDQNGFLWRKDFSNSFGKVALGKSITHEFTIRNAGSAMLKIVSISKSGMNPGSFSVFQPLATSVPPGKNTTFKVNFTPSGTGNRNAAIHIASNDRNQNSFDIALSGAGIAKANTPVFTGDSSSFISLVGFDSSHRFGDSGGVVNRLQTNTTLAWSGGHKYLALVVRKPSAGLTSSDRVEVSPNLLDWYSGVNHTTIMQNDSIILKVRDNTPLIPGTKRYIRLAGD